LSIINSIAFEMRQKCLNLESANHSREPVNCLDGIQIRTGQKFVSFLEIIKFE